ncbi:hypothetical protein HYH03_005769 [Edaphochlamys debaryana]|uniref:Uncharacterized protein n=1 Tax=Edaphochlamys debaryana TaxID=47281 RepID=A0A836C206_9CHLO|nr:hypothetical protein HYH03_005769 [Edaphochlamys debaryana]|eukprot:KAG2496168.1 hypothetical protein HYH03_005769 [Edaphochlamys debaryana]
MVVDLVSLTPFSGLSDAAVDADPLVALPCGHAYTASTLDAWLDMETRFYTRAPPEGDRPGRWLGLRPLPTADQDELKGCPECRGPKTQVYEKAVASARDLVAAEEERRREGEALTSPSAAAGSTGGRPGASVAEAPAAAGQVVWRLGHEVQLTAEVGPSSARSRLEAAEAALAALPPSVDARAVWEAQCAHLDAAALVNRLASSGLLVPPVPEHLLTTPLRSQVTRFRNQLIARADRWSEPALSRAAALALLPAGGREAPGRSTDARLTEAFLGLILARVALLEASARYARNMQDLEDSRRRQEELLEQGGMLLGELSAALSAPAAAGDGGASAGGRQDGRSAADRAAERMALQLSRVAFLQAAKPFAGRADLPNYRAVRRQQEALLDEVQALAAEVEGAHNRSDPQPSGPADPDTPEGPVGRVRRLAERAAEWQEQLRRSGELRDIVEAMARGEIHSGHRISYNTRILAGHLYRPYGTT